MRRQWGGWGRELLGEWISQRTEGGVWCHSICTWRLWWRWRGRVWAYGCAITHSIHHMTEPHSILRKAHHVIDSLTGHLSYSELLKHNLEVCVNSILLLAITMVWALLPSLSYHKEVLKLDFLGFYTPTLITGLCWYPFSSPSFQTTSVTSSKKWLLLNIC